MGSQRIKELYVGGQRIKSAHIWDGAAWQRVHVWPVATPSRVNKSGDQSFTASTYTTPIGWTLAAGYAGAAVSNGLLVVGSGTVDISAQVTAATSTLSKRLQILRNGVQVGDEGAVGGSTPVITASANGGDRIGRRCHITVCTNHFRWIYLHHLGRHRHYIQITAA